MTERRVIAITGASAGIGAALAIRAARAGYAVVAVGRNAEALRQLEQRVHQESGSIATLIGDVRDSGTSKAVAQLAVERFTRLDVLVANAGVAGRGPLVLQTDDELLEQLETHIAAPVTLVRACLPLLIASKGTVFVLGSGVGRIPIGGMGLYPASKAGLRSASRTLRNELKPMKIGLTYVDPGAVDTEFMHRKSMPGAPKLLLTSPFTVAGKILRAVDRRPAELNVVPWQTALLAVVERFPKAVDFALRHAGSITGAPVMKLETSSAHAFERLREAANAPEPKAEVSATPPAQSPSMTARAQSMVAPAQSASEEFRAKANATSAYAGVDVRSASAGDAIAETPTIPSRSASQRSPKIAAEDDPLAVVLTPLMQRMRRQNLSLEMLRARITGGNAFTEDEFALDWVGMPNKNERKLIADICRACADGGLLHERGDKRWQGTKAELATDTV